MRTAGIYAIINIENSKIYIGSTINFGLRWNGHKSELQRNVHSNPHLQHAWNKYGEEAFEFSVLEYLEDVDELAKAEQFWMDLYREEGKELYNIGLAASNWRRGRKCGPLPEETRRKIGKFHKGKKLSKEHKDKIGDGNRGKKRSKETRRRLSEVNKGKKHSKETKQKMSETRKGMVFTEERNRRLSKAKMGHPVSRETREKISKSVKAAWALGVYDSEEARCNMSKAQKRAWARRKGDMAVQGAE